MSYFLPVHLNFFFSELAVHSPTPHSCQSGRFFSVLESHFFFFFFNDAGLNVFVIVSLRHTVVSVIVKKENRTWEWEPKIENGRRGCLGMVWKFGEPTPLVTEGGMRVAKCACCRFLQTRTVLEASTKPQEQTVTSTLKAPDP